MNRLMQAGVAMSIVLIVWVIYPFSISNAQITSCTFPMSLRIGSRGPQVIILQKILNQDPVTQVANIGGGSPGNETSYFGAATRAAIIRFQEKYRSEILTSGQVRGTGIAGPLTRIKLAQLCTTMGTTSSLQPLSPESLINKPLRQGQTDVQVLLLQRLLNKDPQTRVALTGAGSPGKETYYFGPATAAATRRLQQKYSIQQTGVVEGTTLTTVNSLLQSAPPIINVGGGNPSIQSVSPTQQFGGGGSSSGNPPAQQAVPAAPILTFTTSALAVAANSPVTITWTSQNTTQCSASGDWSGAKNVSGSETIPSLSVSKNFSISCVGPGGNTSETIIVSINTPQTPSNPVPVPATGNIIVQRQGLPSSNGQTRIDTRPLMSANPLSIQGITAESHNIYITDEQYYSESLGTCTYPVGGVPCNVTVFNSAPLCLNGICSLQTMVTKDMVTKVVAKYMINFTYTFEKSVDELVVTPGSVGSITITRKALSGIVPPITLYSSNYFLPEGFYVDITNNPCTAGTTQCASEVKFSVPSGTPDASYPITLTSPSDNKSISFNVRVASAVYKSNDTGLKTTCFANATSVQVGKPVTWTAIVSGAGGNYTYTWSGDAAGSESSVISTYSTAGIKTAYLKVLADEGAGFISCSVLITASPILLFDYSLVSNRSIWKVTQGSNIGSVINRKFVSGSAQPVTLSISGLPAEATVTFTNNPCTPTIQCSSAMNIYTTANTPLGTHQVTLTGSPGGKITVFNLVVEAPIPVTGSCSANPLTGRAGQTITWAASAAGGNRMYSYSWSGTEGLSGMAATVSKIYSSQGVKSAQVIITSNGVSTTVACTTNLQQAAAKIIYDAIGYHDKPNLSQFGLTPHYVLYDADINRGLVTETKLPNGDIQRRWIEGQFSVPTTTPIQTLITQRDPGVTIDFTNQPDALEAIFRRTARAAAGVEDDTPNHRWAYGIYNRIPMTVSVDVEHPDINNTLEPLREDPNFQINIDEKIFDSQGNPVLDAKGKQLTRSKVVPYYDPQARQKRQFMSQVYSRAVRAFKDEVARAGKTNEVKLGWYLYLPDPTGNWSGNLTDQQYPGVERYRANAVEDIKPWADEIDAFYPECNFLSSKEYNRADLDAHFDYLTKYFATVRARYPGKPIYCYVGPVWATNVMENGQMVRSREDEPYPQEMFKEYIERTLEITDGVVIWNRYHNGTAPYKRLGWATEVENAPWWKVIKEIAQRYK